MANTAAIVSINEVLSDKVVSSNSTIFNNYFRLYWKGYRRIRKAYKTKRI